MVIQQVHSAEGPRGSPLQDRWGLVLETGQTGINSGDWSEGSTQQEPYELQVTGCLPALFSGGRTGLVPCFCGAGNSTQGLTYHWARSWWFSRFPCPSERKKVTRKEDIPDMAWLHPSSPFPGLLPNHGKSVF